MEVGIVAVAAGITATVAYSSYRPWKTWAVMTYLESLSNPITPMAATVIVVVEVLGSGQAVPLGEGYQSKNGEAPAIPDFSWSDGALVVNNSWLGSAGAAGRTIGPVIFISSPHGSPASAATLSHELSHVEQWYALGGAYIGAHLWAMTLSAAVSGSYDCLNPLEWGPYQGSAYASKSHCAPH